MSSSTSNPSLNGRLEDSNQLTDRPLIRSANHRYSATIHQDGNFVLRDDAKKVDLWSSPTKGKVGPYQVEMKDGSLVLYDTHNTDLWSNKPDNKRQKPYHLEISDDGKIRIVDSKHNNIWCDDATNVWLPAKLMAPGGFIQSTLGSPPYCAGVVNTNDTCFISVYQGVNTLYASATTAGNANNLFLTTDGNLEIVDINLKVLLIWKNPTQTVGAYTLQINNDGSLVVACNGAAAYSVYPASVNPIVPNNSLRL